MKIWYQSAGALDNVKRYNEYAASLKRYLPTITRPGTEVSIHGVELASPYMQTSRYEEVLHDYQIMENLFQAQREGYDAFVVGCIIDPVLYALKEVADIPVLSLAEASMLLACMLSPNFSLLCHHKPLLLRTIELVKRYGLQDRFIECDSFDVSPTDIFRAFQEPEIILKPARKLAEEAAKKGVCMFVNAEGVLNMLMVENNVRELAGIPVLEGAGALVKMGEMLVDLKTMGIARSRLGLYRPLTKDDQTILRNTYGLPPTDLKP